MQPGVIVALATVWLTVAAGVVGANTLRPFRLFDDQYSPTSPRRHGVQRDQTDWEDHEPPEDQPLDLRIGSRKSIFAEDSSDPSGNVERNFALDESVKDAALSKHESSGWQKRLPNIAYREFMLDKVDYGEMPETLSRKVPPSDPDDPFVADDTFQDQGPGSVEIYKLDLSKERALLTATTPSTRLPTKNKSKAPKKTVRVNSKTKTTEMKSMTSPKTHHRQSNFFEEQRTETPVNRDAFDIGGVPELQVGCEGLEASSSYKAKRSLSEETVNLSTFTTDYDYGGWDDDESDEETDELFRLWKLETTTKSNRGDIDSKLNDDYLKIREPDRLPVRGDLGPWTREIRLAVTNSSDPDKLLSDFIHTNATSEMHRNESPKQTDSKVNGHEEAKAKREPDDDSSAGRNGRRLLWLAEANTEGFAGDSRAKRSTDWGFGEDEGVVSSNELQTINERRRQHDMRYYKDARRRDQQQRGPNSEIDTIRQQYERLLEEKQRQEEERRRRVQHGNRRTPDRREEEEARRREYEEYRRRMEYTSTPRTYDEEARRRHMEELRRREMTRDRTQEETARRNEEERRRREEEELKRRSMHDRWQEEMRKRQQKENASRTGYEAPVSEDAEKRRRLQDEEMRRRTEERRRQEDERRRAFDEEARRREQYRLQQEAQRRREEEERRHASQEKKEEEERRRQQDRDRSETPSNLMRPGHQVTGRPNDLEPEERKREQKLREYIARNQPINANRTPGRGSEDEERGYRSGQQAAGSNTERDDAYARRRAEEQRRRQEEERKLQDYIRRNQPVNVPSRGNQSTGRVWFDERRQIEAARRRDGYAVDPGRRRGPSAPTYIDPRSSPEEVRRRQETWRLEEERRQARERQQRYEAEERRKELARRQQQEEVERRRSQEERRKEEVRREEEARREQSRRYEENRKRLEAARMQAERSRQEMLLRERGWRGGGQPTIGDRTRPQLETAMSGPYQDPRLVEHRRRQDSRLIPSNLARDEVRWAVERERQRQEQAMREAEKRRQEEESRIQEQRLKQTYTDQWRRHEIARLHSLPVSARIILRPSSLTTPINPSVGSRADFGNEIDFTGINPSREGVQVAQFPVAPTTRRPIQSPGPCVWAVVQCCSRNNNRLTKCFESMGCPGINWDSNPCRYSIMEAARKEVMKFYAAAEDQ